MITKEPKKPSTVPLEAIWNPSDNEWELGIKNKNGKYIGEWKWWLAPNGHLCCHTFFDDEGNIVSFKRFHPNGEVSQYGKGKNGKFTERVWLRSTAETPEGFPNYPSYVWKAVQKTGTFPIKYDIYDKEDNHLNKKIEIPDNLRIAEVDETAKQALNRLEEAILVVQKYRHKEDKFLQNYYKPVYFQKIKPEEICEAEKRLGIKFPPSYIDFITKYGLFKLGEKNKNYSCLIHPSQIGRLSDALETKWDVNWEDYTPREKEIMDKIIYFSTGDEGLQLCWYCCFDFNTLNKETGEVQIIDFEQHDWSWMMYEDDIEIYMNKAFDEHITEVVDHAIQYIQD